MSGSILFAVLAIIAGALLVAASGRFIALPAKATAGVGKAVLPWLGLIVGLVITGFGVASAVEANQPQPATSAETVQSTPVATAPASQAPSAGAAHDENCESG